MASRRLDDVQAKSCIHAYDGVLVRDSALVYVRLSRVMADMSMTASERVEVMKAVAFPDGCPDDMVQPILEKAYGFEFKQATSAPCFDFEQDAGRIRASLRQQFGIIWDDECATMRATDFLDYIVALVESGDTCFREAVMARSGSKPKGLSGDALHAWQARREYFRLDNAYDPSDPYGDEILRRILG